MQKALTEGQITAIQGQEFLQSKVKTKYADKLAKISYDAQRENLGLIQQKIRELKYENAYKSGTLDNRIQYTNKQLDKLSYEIRNLSLEGQLKALDRHHKQWRKTLNDKGLGINDNLFLRQLALRADTEHLVDYWNFSKKMMEATKNNILNFYK